MVIDTDGDDDHTNSNSNNNNDMIINQIYTTNTTSENMVGVSMVLA